MPTLVCIDCGARETFDTIDDAENGVDLHLMDGCNRVFISHD